VQMELKGRSSFQVLLIQYFTHCWMPTGQSIRACGCRLFLSTRPRTRTQSAWYYHVSRIGVENDEIAIFFSSFSSAAACESIHSLSTRPRHPQTPSIGSRDQQAQLQAGRQQCCPTRRLKSPPPPNRASPLAAPA
jgi:hypothetical protein